MSLSGPEAEEVVIVWLLVIVGKILDLYLRVFFTCLAFCLVKNYILNVIIRIQTLKTDLAAFFHGALFSPVKATLLKAINNNHFVGWPGLTKKLISRHLLDTVATAKGHQNQERQQLQTTKPSNYDNTLK